MRGDTLMRAASSLADRGMAVFPLLPGTKRPAVRRDWEGCATTDIEQIERWWHRAPYNIGVATGPSRLVVVDLDAPRSTRHVRHGWQALADLAGEVGAEVPRDTFTVATPGGGEHLYFLAPSGRSLTNTAGRLGRLIDTRAAGGYVVGPGSRIAGHAYRVVRDMSPAALPSWILTKLLPRLPEQRSAPVGEHPSYVDAAVRDEVRRVEEATSGCRNSVLFQAAANLARFVPEGRLGEDDVRSALTSASARHVGIDGFSAAEVRRTIESGLRRGRPPDRPTSGSSGLRQSRSR